jgi:hypothetical protein
MSTEVTDSTTVSALFYFAVELRNEARNPVMTIVPWLAFGSCVSAAACEAFAAGCAATAALAAPVTAGLGSAIAGLVAIARASGLAAAAKRQRE